MENSEQAPLNINIKSSKISDTSFFNFLKVFNLFFSWKKSCPKMTHPNVNVYFFMYMLINKFIYNSTR